MWDEGRDIGPILSRYSKNNTSFKAKMLLMCDISENILNRCFIFIHIIRWGLQFLWVFSFGGGGGSQILMEIRVINPFGNYVDDTVCARIVKASHV